MLKQILPVLVPQISAVRGYVEPFLGSGAVARAVLDLLPESVPAILADADPWVVAVWCASQYHADALIEACRGFVPTVDAFQEFRAAEFAGPPPDDTVRAALQKLALHAMSFGGLGPLAGSPIGGLRQTGKYKIGCRWSPSNIALEVRRTAAMCARRPVTCCVADFRAVLACAGSGWLAYLDPPYWSAGPAMYRRSFTPDDHENLAVTLEQAPFRWVLSYDDDRRVVQRYAGWATMHTIEGTTQAGGGTGERRIKELLLSGSPRPRVNLSNLLGAS